MDGYSPTLSLATGIFEAAAAIWALTVKGRRAILVPSALILFLLSGYQFAEILICVHPAKMFPARLAFMEIAFLPPLAVWLLHELSESGRKRLRFLALSLGVWACLLSALILFHPDFVSTSVCSVVFARYQNPPIIYKIYGLYYDLGLLILLFGGVLSLKNSRDPLLREHLTDLCLGSIGFIVPSLFALMAIPGLAGSTPSVLCHFALVLALFLTRLIDRERKSTH